MIFSFKQLKKMANLPKSITIDEVVKKINLIGFEVENVIATPKIKGIKFGKILKAYSNPNGTKLTVCEIQFSDKKRIIQTTSIIKVGMTVCAFVPGSSIDDFTFGSKKLKGIESEGMLTTLNEFGFKEELVRNLDGILDYGNIDINIDPTEYLMLNDYLIDVSILTNRADANSYYIFAQELAAAFNTTIKLPKRKIGNMKTSVKVTKGLHNNLVMVEAKSDFKITIPEQVLLMKSNIKSINDNVDLTNLVLLMTGQPTHAYDKDNVGTNFSSKLITKKQINILGKKIDIQKSLVITSDDIPVSIAGVIGLNDSSCKKDTKNIIIEMGQFAPNLIRHSSKQVKLDTMSSRQASKLNSLGILELAYNYLSMKMKNFSEPINMPKILVQEIQYDKEQTNLIAGFELSKTKHYLQSLKSLKKLGFIYENNKDIIPSYRYDIKMQEYIDEEIFRFYDYNNFPILPVVNEPMIIDSKQDLKSRISSQGYNEIKTYSLISKKINDINPFNFKTNISLQTFVSHEREVIRYSQIPLILQVFEYHKKRKINNLSLFSYGMITSEEFTYILASEQKTLDEIKKDVCNLLQLNVKFVRFQTNGLHPNIAVKIMFNNTMIGYIGKIHPSYYTGNLLVAEFKDPLNLSIKQNTTFQDYSSESFKVRDITIKLNKHEDLDKHLTELRKLDVFSIKIIDEYKDDITNNVTIRVICNSDVAKKIDELQSLLI